MRATIMTITSAITTRTTAQSAAGEQGIETMTRHTGNGSRGALTWLHAVLLGLMLGLAGTAHAALTVNITGPVDNTVALAPANFTLNATASNLGGAPIQSVAFYFYDGTSNNLLTTITAPHGVGAVTLPAKARASAAPITSASDVVYSWDLNDVPAGVYSVTAVVTDQTGNTATSAPVTVVADVPPAIDLVAPANNTVQTAPASFILTADAASQIGSIAEVEFYNGATLLATVTAAPYTYTWNNVPAGAYSLTAKATDNYGITNTSTAITVISNQAPTVNLTGPANNTVATAPGNFTLTAEATDSDGTIAKVDFYADGTLIGTATSAPYTIDWSNVPAGSYTLTAVATDNLGAQTTSGAVNVTVIAPPAVSLTAPANNTVIIAPGSLTLTANATSAGSIAKVDFYNGATLIGTATAAPYSYTWSNVPAGSYTLTAKATDGYGIDNTSSAINVVSNATPTVSLTGPAANAVSVAPGSFTLTAEATDSDGTIAKIEFHAIDNATNAGTLIGTATQAPYTTNWSNIPAGSYTLSAVATDTLGAQTTSSQVTVTVNTGIAQAYYIHTDHLNSPRTITDTSGNIVWQWDNTDPFGANIPDENPNSQGTFTFNLRFPGQYFDRETNTHYNFYRDGYNPEIGAYTQSDPIGLQGGINTYTYVGGNPLSRVDPLGLDWQFSQGSGQWTHIDNQTGAQTNVGTGYSGTGAGRNNSAMQNVPNVGPTPQGTYDIGPAYNNPNTGPSTMNLTPQPGTNTFGRDLFRIHGNNAANDASHGCPIAPPDVRNQINDSPDRVLHVVP